MLQRMIKISVDENPTAQIVPIQVMQMEQIVGAVKRTTLQRMLHGSQCL